MKIRMVEPMNVYKFKRYTPNDESRRQKLATIFKKFAEESSRTLSELFQTEVLVALDQLEQISIGHYLKTLARPTCLSTAKINPHDALCYFEINSIIVYTAINMMLGGEGDIPFTVKEMTPLELALNRKFVILLFDKLRRAFAPHFDIEFQLNAISVNSHDSLDIPREESAEVASLKVYWKKNQGLMTLALVSSQLEFLNAAVQGFAEEESPQQKKEALLDLSKIDVEVKARLGRLQLSKTDLELLRTGDILAVEKTKGMLIDVLVNDQVCFEAIPGLSGKNKAFAITKSQGVHYDAGSQPRGN